MNKLLATHAQESQSSAPLLNHDENDCKTREIREKMAKMSQEIPKLEPNVLDFHLNHVS